MARISVQDAGSPNVCAFLDMLAFSEIGPKLLINSDDGYNVLVGSTPNHPYLFDSYDQHPNKLMKLSEKLSSTAAGRYQFLKRTFDELQQVLSLPDFSPISQDKACILQLMRGGSVSLIEAGNISAAINKENHIWASLPGSPYGQPTHSMDDLLKIYTAALSNYK